MREGEKRGRVRVESALRNVHCCSLAVHDDGKHVFAIRVLESCVRSGVEDLYGRERRISVDHAPSVPAQHSTEYIKTNNHTHTYTRTHKKEDRSQPPLCGALLSAYVLVFLS